MHYVRARINTELRSLSYKVYMTDAIQAMGQKKYPLERWYDSLFSESPTDTRTADEIAIDIITRAGLKFKNPKEGDSE